MERSWKNYWKLFSSVFTISALTFGGGFVIISLMQKKFVEQFKWVEQEEMIDITSLAQSSPGPIAVNAAILLGYRLLGFLGIVVAVLGTIIPPIVVISFVAYFYAFFADNIIFRLIITGMTAGVAAVVVDAALSVGKTVLKGKNYFGIVITSISFIVLFIFHVNAIFIILGSGIAGVIYGKTKSKDKKKGEITRGND